MDATNLHHPYYNPYNMLDNSLSSVRYQFLSLVNNESFSQWQNQD